MAINTEKSPKHLIQILVDHASPEAFFGWIDKGIAPHISKYILGEKNKDGTYANATISRNIVTGYPSTSANSHTSILTGSYARKNNLVHTTYWDFTGKVPRFRDTEKISLKGLKEMNTLHINPLCKTLFEYTDNSASFHALNRGASYKLLNTRAILFKFLPLLLKIKKTHGSEGIEPYSHPEFWKALFKDNIADFLRKIGEDKNIPIATFIVYLYSDDMGHKYGFNSEQYKVAMEILDLLVQGIVEGMEDKKGDFVPGLKELGYLDSVVWSIVTDHAARRVYRDKLVFINSLANIEQDLNIVDGELENIKDFIKGNQKEFSKVNGFSEIADEVWHCWLGGPEGKKPIDFRRFYGEEYIRKIIPKANQNKRPIDFIDYCLSQQSVQLVIIPEETKEGFENFLKLKPEQLIQTLIPRTYHIKIFSKEGMGQIERSEKNNDYAYSYQILKGNDPLGYDKIGLEYGKSYSQHEWLEKTIEHDLPDVPHRLYGFFDSIYAPNVAITSARDYHFLSLYKVAKKKEKMLKNFQTHGGIFGEESIVPLTLAGPGVKKGFEIPIGRNIDILPTVLRVLNLDFDEKKIDGKILEEALE